MCVVFAGFCSDCFAATAGQELGRDVHSCLPRVHGHQLRTTTHPSTLMCTTSHSSQEPCALSIIITPSLWLDEMICRHKKFAHRLRLESRFKPRVSDGRVCTFYSQATKAAHESAAISLNRNLSVSLSL